MRAVHAMGLPVPAPEEVVEVEGRPGIVMERIVGPSLLQLVQAKPWRLRWAVRTLGDLHTRINSCTAPAVLASQREKIASRITSSSSLSDEDKLSVVRCLNELPDGDALCHGDFHPGNIIIAQDGPVVIDWDAATRGRPAGDAAYTLHLIRSANLPFWIPRYMHLLLSGTRSMIRRGYLKEYLRSHLATRNEIQRWYTPVAAEVQRRLEGARSVEHSG